MFCYIVFFFLIIPRPPRSTLTDTLFPYTTLFRSTFPFPQTTIDDGMRGDYTNLWALIDLTSNRLQSGLGFGAPFGAPQTPVENGVLVDPLTAPLGTDRKSTRLNSSH